MSVDVDRRKKLLQV